LRTRDIELAGLITEAVGQTGADPLGGRKPVVTVAKVRRDHMGCKPWGCRFFPGIGGRSNVHKFRGYDAEANMIFWQGAPSGVAT